MAAGSAAERAEAGGKEMAKKRGREVRLCPCTIDTQPCIKSLPLLPAAATAEALNNACFFRGIRDMQQVR